jgi:hypothetical protein
LINLSASAKLYSLQPTRRENFEAVIAAYIDREQRGSLFRSPVGVLVEAALKQLESTIRKWANPILERALTKAQARLVEIEEAE